MFETRTSSSAVTELLVWRRDADIEEMALAGTDRDDAVADDAIARLIHLADVTESETVAQDTFGPRKLVGDALDRQDRGHVRLLHVAQVRKRVAQHRAHGVAVSAMMLRARRRSSHALRLSDGVRNRYAGW